MNGFFDLIGDLGDKVGDLATGHDTNPSTSWLGNLMLQAVDTITIIIEKDDRGRRDRDYW